MCGTQHTTLILILTATCIIYMYKLFGGQDGAKMHGLSLQGSDPKCDRV